MGPVVVGHWLAGRVPGGLQDPQSKLPLACGSPSSNIPSFTPVVVFRKWRGVCPHSDQAGGSEVPAPRGLRRAAEVSCPQSARLP